jgi:hypothetical protein
MPLPRNSYFRRTAKRLTTSVDMAAAGRNRVRYRHLILDGPDGWILPDAAAVPSVTQLRNPDTWPDEAAFCMVACTGCQSAVHFPSTNMGSNLGVEKSQRRSPRIIEATGARDGKHVNRGGLRVDRPVKMDSSKHACYFCVMFWTDLADRS